MSGKLTVTHRLLRDIGFDHVVQAGNVANSIFKIFFVKNEKKNARLGIIVGKKVLAGAVDRNNIKRIIREAFRQHRIKQSNLDVVVLVRHSFPLERRAYADNLRMLFNRIDHTCAEL